MNSPIKVNMFLFLNGFFKAVIAILLVFPVFVNAQKKVWHDTVRQIHYRPKGESFELVSGKRRFNRAIYGTNTGFRLEAGDLPEFAIYMPGMGGNFKLGLSNGNTNKWITSCDSIVTTYTPGTMIYNIKDAILKEGKIQVQVLALAESEGFIAKITAENLPEDLNLIWVYGGASGKKFHRDGDIGADPESVFYLQPKYCINNAYVLGVNGFQLEFGSESNKKKTGNNRSIIGAFPSGDVKLASANYQNLPLEVYQSTADTLPVIVGQVNLKAGKPLYWKFENANVIAETSQGQIAEAFQQGLEKVANLRNRVIIKTPDAFLNTLGGALAIAGDAIWEDPAYLHGAVAWRMHLNAWRGAYVADPLGWKDRAETHFRSYGNSQVLSPETGPVVLDSSRNFARQKEVLGTSMFSKGYICRHPNNNSVAHHYDMNSVFINQLLRHYLWTGDLDFIKELWPVVKRHLEWEKRNFDVDNDGLYDAYACIWASDALQYSGGGVTYASAYNYSANRIAAQIAAIFGEDPTPYKTEANRIKNAIQNALWITDKGVYAEFKDLQGNQLLHENPGLWTIYHSLDEGIADGFLASQMLNYTDYNLPHIPVATNTKDTSNMFLLTTTNWQPYTWSVNNVALAENLHAALGYWQGGDKEKGFRLWKSALVESMYFGASPGGFQQLSFYDALRGELYRDFADPIGIAARSLVEGLFGISPNALEKTVTITPGFPSDWDFAELNSPDISYTFEREGLESTFKIQPKFHTPLGLKLIIKPEFSEIKQVKVNGDIVDFKMNETAVGAPEISIERPYAKTYDVNIICKGDAIEKLDEVVTAIPESTLKLITERAEILMVYDPQHLIENFKLKAHQLEYQLKKVKGDFMFFVQLKQNDVIWWQPIKLEIKAPFSLSAQEDDTTSFKIILQKNVSEADIKQVFVNGKAVKGFEDSETGNLYVELLKSQCLPGTNRLEIVCDSGNYSLIFQNWNLVIPENYKTETVELTSVLNAKVTDVFQQKYETPRPSSPTLQLPLQGIGNWCYPYVLPVIDDTGLRKQVVNDCIFSPQNIPLKTTKESLKNNIAWTSMWENYPETIELPLQGKASHAYFLMAGTTNPMQSQMVNGLVTVKYTDGTFSVLELKNPENWWPIEQDYYTDGYAFTTNGVKPPRLYLKSGQFVSDFKDFVPIKGYSNFGIEGGASTLLDLPLEKDKTLKSVEIKSIANDVVIGLMSLTLVRN